MRQAPHESFARTTRACAAPVKSSVDKLIRRPRTDPKAAAPSAPISFPDGMRNSLALSTSHVAVHMLYNTHAPCRRKVVKCTSLPRLGASAITPSSPMLLSGVTHVRGSLKYSGCPCKHHEHHGASGKYHEHRATRANTQTQTPCRAGLCTPRTNCSCSTFPRGGVAQGVAPTLWPLQCQACCLRHHKSYQVTRSTTKHMSNTTPHVACQQHAPCSCNTDILESSLSCENTATAPDFPPGNNRSYMPLLHRNASEVTRQGNRDAQLKLNRFTLGSSLRLRFIAAPTAGGCSSEHHTNQLMHRHA